MAVTITLESLPNEILAAVLSSLTTTTLLSCALVSHRFYNTIVQVLHTRLVSTSLLEEHLLILDCAHPSTRVITPLFFLANLGAGTRDQPQIIESGEGIGELEKLKGIYSHFRPLLPADIDRISKCRVDSWSLDTSNSLSEIQTEYICQNVHLESHELFSQLCIGTDLLKSQQHSKNYQSHVKVSGGVIRIWKDWLAERCASTKCDRPNSELHIKRGKDEESRRCLLWADPEENIGLRFRVTERRDISPFLAAPGEEPPVFYRLQYEELVLRTTQILLALEEFDDQGHEASFRVPGRRLRSWNRYFM